MFDSIKVRFKSIHLINKLSPKHISRIHLIFKLILKIAYSTSNYSELPEYHFAYVILPIIYVAKIRQGLYPSLLFGNWELSQIILQNGLCSRSQFSHSKILVVRKVFESHFHAHADTHCVVVFFYLYGLLDDNGTWYSGAKSHNMWGGCERRCMSASVETSFKNLSNN